MRLPSHDYRSGAVYFITFVTASRRPLLSTICTDTVELTSAGLIVEKHWNNLQMHFPRVVNDAVCFMPDHVHAILYISDVRLTQPDNIHACKDDTVSLSEVIRGWKSFSALEINKLYATTGQPVWQRGFIDRIIRSDDELDKFRGYIQTNPLRFNNSQKHK